MLTLMKSDKVVETVQPHANSMLFYEVWYRYWHFKKDSIFYRETIRSRARISIKIHKGMPVVALEKPPKICCVNTVRSKNRIKWRHYAISAKFISIHRTNWSSCRDAGIINKIIISDHIISPDIISI